RLRLKTLATSASRLFTLILPMRYLPTPFLTQLVKQVIAQLGASSIEQPVEQALSNPLMS
ncbi:MAG: hypothetical protein WBA10_16370, partial [Elainellaceae cyanobacterium]